MRWLPLLALAITTQVLAGEQCRAIDGHTLRCGRERVRLVGIYAPELNAPAGKPQRPSYNGASVPDLVIDRHGRDKYGRTLGHLYVDGSRVKQSDIGARAGRGSKSRF